jgi:Tetratricopeptide repeat
MSPGQGLFNTLLERSLAIREQALGPGHPDTAWSLTNLGILFHDRAIRLRPSPSLSALWPFESGRWGLST